MEAFKKGNLDSWVFTIQQYLPKALQKLEAADNVACQALQELLGENGFTKDSGKMYFTYDKAGLPKYVKVEFLYQSNFLAVPNATREAVVADTSFIRGYLNQIQGARLEDFVLDNNNGTVYLCLSTPIGIMND